MSTACCRGARRLERRRRDGRDRFAEKGKGRSLQHLRVRREPTPSQSQPTTARPGHTSFCSDSPYAQRCAPESRERHRRPTEPFRGSHTATFPSKLVEPCVLPGSSAAGCCSRCGRPWERLVRSLSAPLSRRRESCKDPWIFIIEMRQLREAKTTGWRPTCECGAAATLFTGDVGRQHQRGPKPGRAGFGERLAFAVGLAARGALRGQATEGADLLAVAETPGPPDGCH